MNAEVYFKRLPRGVGSHQKKKKTESELSFRVQKPYEDQFGFETWGRFSMKTQNCLMYAHLDGDWKMKGKRG